MGSEAEYIVFDRASGNQLGEFESFEEAEETFLQYVAAAPKAAGDLEIWLDDNRVDVDPDKIRRVSAA